jgi:electron transfer flavoprotein alpha subunit
MYAGNALATLQSSDDVKLLSVRPTAFDKAPEASSPPFVLPPRALAGTTDRVFSFCVLSVQEGGNAPIEAAALPDQPDAGLAKFVSESAGGGERPDLTGARVVVSGGRGLKSGENFAMLEEMADVLGGAVGATRAAVDAGFVPNELQVGQTGKVIAPEVSRIRKSIPMQMTS